MEVEIAEAKVKRTANDFKGKGDPDWCPGCGDFGVLNSLQKADFVMSTTFFDNILESSTVTLKSCPEGVV